MTEQQSERVPIALQGQYDAITALTDQFCQAHLTAEYGDLCRRMIAKLCRKRPSPLAAGKPNTWACGVVYSAGRVNFLFDRSQTPNLTADELCSPFGVSKSTGSAKSTAILKWLNSHQGDPKWTLPSRIGENPLAWMIQVDGFILDARTAPREIQEEALRRGLIPYLP